MDNGHIKSCKMFAPIHRGFSNQDRSQPWGWSQNGFNVMTNYLAMNYEYCHKKIPNTGPLFLRCI